VVEQLGDAGAANAVPAAVDHTNGVREEQGGALSADRDRVHGAHGRSGDANLEVVAAAALVGDGAHVVLLAGLEGHRGGGLCIVLVPLAVGGPAGDGGNLIGLHGQVHGLANPEEGVVVGGDAEDEVASLWGHEVGLNLGAAVVADVDRSLEDVQDRLLEGRRAKTVVGLTANVGVTACGRPAAELGVERGAEVGAGGAAADGAVVVVGTALRVGVVGLGTRVAVSGHVAAVARV